MRLRAVLLLYYRVDVKSCTSLRSTVEVLLKLTFFFLVCGTLRFFFARNGNSIHSIVVFF